MWDATRNERLALRGPGRRRSHMRCSSIARARCLEKFWRMTSPWRKTLFLTGWSASRGGRKAACDFVTFRPVRARRGDTNVSRTWFRKRCSAKFARRRNFSRGTGRRSSRRTVPRGAGVQQHALWHAHLLTTRDTCAEEITTRRGRRIGDGRVSRFISAPAGRQSAHPPG